jgi:probable phosphoglycerate mutase
MWWDGSMSDLQCAVRIFVARHGQAEYESSLLGDFGGCLTGVGRRQARALADEVRDERIAAIITSPMVRAVQTAEIVGHALGVDQVVVREGLREFSVGDHAGGTGDPDPFAETFRAWGGGRHDARIAGGESGREVFERMRAVLDDIADAFRGESVLVLSHGGVMSYTLPQLATNLRDAHAMGYPLGNCALVALEGDSDGWVARSWAGEKL